MMERYEIEKLRSLPCEGVAQRLGLTIKHHKALCPFHDDHTPSLTFRNNKYKCWSCGESGDTISLVMKLQNVGFKEACQYLGGSPLPAPPLGECLGDSRKDGSGNEALPQRGRWRGLSFYERFFSSPWLNEEARHFLFEERHLDERVVRWCRLTSWRDRKGIPWLQIPYYNREGKLIGIQNRNLTAPSKPDPNLALPSLTGGVGGGSLPRFRFPRGSQCGIYNLPVLNLLKPGDELYIAEGCSDCWSLLSAGHKAIAIPSATLLTNDVRGKMEEVRGKFDIQFHMWPDRDAPGERLFLQLQKVLPNLVHHQLPPDCKDFSELYVKMKK